MQLFDPKSAAHIGKGPFKKQQLALGLLVVVLVVLVGEAVVVGPGVVVTLGVVVGGGQPGISPHCLPPCQTAPKKRAQFSWSVSKQVLLGKQHLPNGGGGWHSSSPQFPPGLNDAVKLPEDRHWHLHSPDTHQKLILLLKQQLPFCDSSQLFSVQGGVVGGLVVGGLCPHPKENVWHGSLGNCIDDAGAHVH
jgi:hypothetical protein